MTNPATARPFLVAEVEALEPFGFVAVVPGGRLLHIVQVTQREDGSLEVRVPGSDEPSMPAGVGVPAAADSSSLNQFQGAIFFQSTVRSSRMGAASAPFGGRTQVTCQASGRSFGDNRSRKPR